MSDNFTLSCCSTVDVPYQYLESRRIPVLFYTYVVEDVTYVDDMGRDPQALPRFYEMLAAGKLRGGAYKPRTSPYAFQGFGAPALELLAQTGREVGLPTVSEITDAAQLPQFEQVDMLQVGARNMQNYELLRALGQQSKPVLLKRAVGATVEELLQSAEYILAGGNPNVVLCERGVRSFSKTSRAALDVSAIPVLKRMTHLPVIVDPSHAAGEAALVPPLALAAVAAGADGLLIEVHDRPAAALSDAAQSLSCTAFAELAEKIKKVREAIEA